MSLVAGSYEHFLWGYKLKPTTPPSLTPLFSYSSHQSPIKSVTLCGTIAATSSSDDTLKLYDISTCHELGSHLISTTYITSLSFYSHPSTPSLPRSLLAGSHDGSFSIFDVTPSFVHLTTFPVHKKGKGVNSLSVHPSGKVALTVGKDCCLGMVNLVLGRRSFICRLESEAEIVGYCWEGGERFFVVSGDKVTLHDSEDAKLVDQFVAKKKVLCAAPTKKGLIFMGGEDRGITAWDTVGGKVAYSIEDAHKARVKGIVVLSESSESDEDPFLVASASSDGVIRVWDVRAINKDSPTPLSEVNTKSRLTCLAGSSIKSFKRFKVSKDVTMETAGDQKDSSS